MIEQMKQQADPIIDRVCSEFGISRVEVMGDSRKHRASTPRKLLMHILRGAGWQLAEIGELLNNRHHSTIIYGIKDIEVRLRDSVAMQASLDRVMLGTTCAD
jgi:chromosomal replication initiation ATPase DnaA